jgi:RNA 3'-terminal phosphate cyclase (ATP)
MTRLHIDSAMGEGGGQVLRGALSLSLLTGRPFQLSRIRANRNRPGLRAQHLMAVQAAA